MRNDVATFTGIFIGIIFAAALLWTNATVNEWGEHGCDDGQALSLTLRYGSPEWYQYCT